jgi:hypothetical protein
VLGVDGLPLGDRLAVAVGGTVVTELALALGDDRSVPARIRAAFDLATEQVGAPPVEVRLVAVDDGQDGCGYLEAELWLVPRGATFVVLDPAVITFPDPDPTGTGVTDDSSLRARAAALW